MGNFALVNSEGSIVRTAEFEVAPVLAPSKGLRWVTDVRPDYNPLTHRVPTPVEPVVGDSVTYVSEPIPVAEQLHLFKQRVEDAVSKKLDVFARSRGYDGIVAGCSYLGSADTKYAEEASDCIKNRDLIWNATYAYFGKLDDGTTPFVNDVDAAVAALPALLWSDGVTPNV